MVSLSLFAGHRSDSLEGFPYSLRSHASLPPQSLNHAIQYLRRLSQDPPSQSNLSFMQFTCCINVYTNCYYCNKASNRIVPKQKELVVFIWIILSHEVSRHSPHKHIHKLR